MNLLMKNNEELKKAIMKGNTSRVKYLLENKTVNINARIRYTNNPNIAEYIALIWAAEKGYKEIVILLLKQSDIDVNIKDSQGFTALMCAAEQGHNDIIELLLEHPNINVNIQNNRGATALMQAAVKGHKKVVQQFLNHPDIDINIKTINGGSAITGAMLYGHKDIVNLLLHPKPPKAKVKLERSEKVKVSNNTTNIDPSLSEKNCKNLSTPEWISKITRMRVRGENFNSQNSEGNTILMYITKFADLEILQMILNEKDVNGNRFVDVNIKNKNEETALLMATQANNDKKSMLLLKYGADIELAKKKASNKVCEKLEEFRNQIQKANKKLLVAIVSKRYQLAKDLLEKSPADANFILTQYKNTILMTMADQGCTEAVELLLQQPSINVNLQDTQGITALMVAASRGHDKIVKMLLDHGVDVNHQDIPQHFTALICASEKGHDKVVEILLDHNANVNLQGNKGQTALLLAIYFGSMENGHIIKGHMKNAHMKIIEQLLKHNADVNIKDNDGDTVLMTATYQECDKVVKLLLEHNVNENDKNIALMMAVELGNEKIVKMLLDHLANVNYENQLGITPLIHSILHRHERVVKLLLENGANVNSRNVFNNTPLIYAIRSGNARIVKLLLENGADVNTKDSFWNTPLMQAIESGNTRIIELLLNQQKDIDFNMVNYFGETLLSCAEKIGRNKIIKLIQSKMKLSSEQIKPTQEEIKLIQPEVSEEVSKPTLPEASEEEKIKPTLPQASEEEKVKPTLPEISEEEKIKLTLPEASEEVSEPTLPEATEEEKIKPTQSKPTESIEERFWEAVSQGDGNKMDSLLDEKDVDCKFLINKRNKSGNTALIISTQNGYINVIKSLLECVEDPSISLKNNDIDYALLIASDNGNLNIVRLLLSNGADFSFKDINGDNALIKAATKDHFDVVEELIHQNAIINAQGKNNRTALMIAAENGFIRMVKLLLKKNAKVTVKDNYNKTALDIVNEKINDIKNKKKENKFFDNLKTIKEILTKKNNQPSKLFEFSLNLDVDKWDVIFTSNYEKNKKFWEKNQHTNYSKIQELIKEIKLDPFRGRGQPEPLIGELKGLYSRKIDKNNRLVYEVDGEKVILKSCKGHYKQEKRNYTK